MLFICLPSIYRVGLYRASNPLHLMSPVFLSLHPHFLKIFHPPQCFKKRVLNIYQFITGQWLHIWWYSSTFDDFFVSLHIKPFFGRFYLPQLSTFNIGGSENMVLKISTQWCQNLYKEILLIETVIWGNCHMFWCHLIFLCAVWYTLKQSKTLCKNDKISH